MQQTGRSVRLGRAALALAAALAAAASSAPAAASTRISDFNGDGYGDVAVATRYDRDGLPPGGVLTSRGVVHVIYGSLAGLHASAGAQAQVWKQEDLRFPRQPSDHFGEAMAAGDFDGDGYCDLAVSAYNYDLGSVWDAGLVYVLYGTPSGLSKTGAQAFTERFGGFGPVANGHQYGKALASGDFDADGDDDLVVNAAHDGGRVYVYKGTPAGLRETGAKRIEPADRQAVFYETFRVTVDAEGRYSNFGSVLAVGDFGKGDADDLAIGSRDADISVYNLLTSQRTSFGSAGAAFVYYGGADGIVTTQSDYLVQQWVLGNEKPELNDHLGQSLAAGDFDDDGWDDLAIGVPGESVTLPSPVPSAVPQAGAVHVAYGGAGGITDGAAANALRRSDQFWHQNVGTVQGTAEYGDGFGAALAAGNFGYGSAEDLAIGVPDEDVGAVSGAGAVHLLYGGAGGLSDAGNSLYTQDTSGVPGAVGTYDFFGHALAAANFGASRLGDYDDLAVGATQDTYTVAVEGSVTILYGGSGGPAGLGSFQIWTQDSYGIPLWSQQYENFGYVVEAR